VNDLIQGSFRVSLHAKIRMGERSVSDNDIMEAGRTARRVTEQENGKFRVDGFDLEGDELTVICAWAGDTLIVTLF
jgi:Domain of unknown function (DUF4258)